MAKPKVKLLPREPTPEMVNAGRTIPRAFTTGREIAEQIWAVMWDTAVGRKVVGKAPKVGGIR